MKTTAAAMAILLAALGLADAGYLTFLKIEDAVTGRADSVICSALSDQGCQIALQSPMAAVFGIPVSVFALAAYGVILGLLIARLVRGADSPVGRFARPALSVIVLGALIWSVALAAYSASQDSWCALCVGLYGVNAGLAVAGRLLFGEWPWASLTTAIRDVMATQRTLILTCLSFVVAVGAVQGLTAWAIANGRTMRQAADRDRLEAALRGGRIPMVMDGIPVEGPEDAPLTIMKFSDLECPHCSRYFANLDAFHQESPDLIRVGFRHFPLDSECNPFFQRPLHPRACAAARAAICAQEQGRFFEFARVVFQHQDKLSAADLSQWATEAGLDVGVWETCTTAPRTAERLRTDILLGRALGVEGTPGNVINGVYFEGGFRLESLRYLVEELPERLETSPPPKNAVLSGLSNLSGQAHPASPARPISLGPPESPVIEIRVGPERARDRALLAGALQFAGTLPTLARIHIRIDSPVGCPADSPDCTLSRRLACGWHLGIELALARRLSEPAAPPLDSLSKLSPGLVACAAGPVPDGVLAEDRQALSEFGTAPLRVDGIPVDLGLDLDVATPERVLATHRRVVATLERVVAAALLARSGRAELFARK